MQRARSPGARSVCRTSAEHNRLFAGLALLLAVLVEVSPLEGHKGLSTTITSNNDPSAMQQLVTFSALAELAEEENLDWGSLTRLGREGAPKHVTTLSADSTASSVTEHTLPDDPTASGSDAGTDDRGTHEPGVLSSGSASSTASSRRRPHRRLHRKKGGSDDSASTAAGCDASAAVPSAPLAPSVHNHRVWSQLHLMEVAYSTRSNNFIHVTERFAEYQRMYPVVYQCALSSVGCPAEAELLANPTTGLASSSNWSCEHCGRRHSAVRESCLRCHAPSRYAKLFVGQAVKEVNCASSLVRLLHATHPDVPLHRVDCHRDTAGRGKGCAALYVDRAHVATLCSKLSRNVFFDVDDNTGQLMAHYVYTEQQPWLEELVAERTHRGDPALASTRPSYLPWNSLVVEPSNDDEPVQPPQRKRGAADRGRGTHSRTTQEHQLPPAEAETALVLAL